MNIIYCDDWFFSRREPIKPMTEDVARKLHKARKPYTAVLCVRNRARFIVGMYSDNVIVQFLESQFRLYKQYEFHRVGKGKMYLGAAHFYKYDDDGDLESQSRSFTFDRTGPTYFSVHVPGTPCSTRELTPGAALTWEKWPDFGNYLYLFKKNHRMPDQRRFRKSED